MPRFNRYDITTHDIEGVDELPTKDYINKKLNIDPDLVFVDNYFCKPELDNIKYTNKYTNKDIDYGEWDDVTSIRGHADGYLFCVKNT